MSRKALIVGVSNYSPVAIDLPSSAIEREKWRSLLVDAYDFLPGDIQLLDDSNAMRGTILDRLTWLLGNGEPGDQLAFIFCGHGLRAYRNDSDDLQDEALVALPAGAADPMQIAIFDHDLAELYADMAVAPGVCSTFIFDCCYSGGFEFSDGARTRRVRVSPGSDALNALRFGLRLADLPVTTPPVVIAAAQELEPAMEVGGGHPRSLFSSLAIEALCKTPQLTYCQLLAAITPRMKFAQEPLIRGSADRIKRQFLK